MKARAGEERNEKREEMGSGRGSDAEGSGRSRERTEMVREWKAI